MLYENFDIHIDVDRGSDYSLAVHNSPFGDTQRVEWQSLPEDDPDFIDFVYYLRNLIAKPEDAEALGQMLHSFLFPEAIQSLYDRSLQKVRAEGKKGLRVRLRISSELAGLHEIPWEYCHDGEQFPALNVTTPLVRYPPTSKPAISLLEEDTMRILVAMAANPEGYKPLDVEKEERWIRRALSDLEKEGRVSLKVVKQASADTLSSAVLEFQPHIVHFNGHGDLKEDGEGALVLHDPQGRARLAGATDMMVLLRDRGVSLVILSACRTAAGGSAKVLMGVAPRLVAVGIPAAIGMQFDVPQETAEIFMRILYSRLADHARLDTAVTEARNHLYFTHEDKPLWGIPVLFMRAPDGLVWQMEALLARFGVSREFLKLPDYYIARPQITGKLKEQLRQGESATAITLVHGMAAIGKTTLAKALALEVWTDFPDGMFWVDLKQNPDVRGLLGDLIQKLGDYKFRPNTVAGASQHLSSLLEQKQILLVLNDAWQYEDVEPFLVGGPRCRILITSRQDTLFDDSSYRPNVQTLGILTVRQSLNMLEKLHRKKSKSPFSDEEKYQALALVKAAGRVPLALKLAWQRIDAGLSWEEVIDDLEDEVTELDRQLPGNRRLEASINLSLRSLRGKSKNAWRRFVWLGVLPKGVAINAEAAAALWQISPVTAGRTLERLSNENLLLTAPVQQIRDRALPAYVLHDLLHDVARRRLAASEEDAGLGFGRRRANKRLLRNYKKRTKNNLWHTLPADGYIQANLTWHMERAGNFETVHQLLEEETENGRNGWYLAPDPPDKGNAYAADVYRAWRLSEEAYEDLQSEKAIGRQCRYALIIASLNSLAGNLPPELLVALVQHKVWPPRKALAYVERIPNAYAHQRVEALKSLATLLPPELLPQALEAAQAIEDKGSQTYALAALIPRLAEEEHAQALEQALDAAWIIEDAWSQAKALAALLPHLSGAERAQVLEKALEAAQEIEDEASRINALATLITYLPGEKRAQVLEGALDAAQNIEDEEFRANALADLLPSLPEAERSQVLEKALDAAQIVDGAWPQAKALADLLPHLPEEKRAQVLEEALAVARAIKDAWSRTDALTALIPHLSEAERTQVLEEALAVARTIEPEWSLVNALTALIPHLSEAERAQVLEEALAAARTIKDEESQVNALVFLLPHLPERERTEVLDRALAAAQAIEDEWPQAEALYALVPYLSEEERVLVLDQALTDAQAIEDDVLRDEALALLAPHLPEEERTPAMEQALAEARAIEAEESRDEASYALASDLSEEERAQVLKRGLAVARSYEAELLRNETLTALTPLLAELPEDMLYPLWRQTLPELARRDREDLLADIGSLLPVIEALGGQEALSETAEAIVDTGRWWP